MLKILNPTLQLVFFENLTAIIFVKPADNSKNSDKKFESLNSFKQIKNFFKQIKNFFNKLKFFSNKLKFFQTN